MPISFGELQRNTRALTVEYDGVTVGIVYRPGIITPASNEEFSKQAVALQLEQLLVSWDVLDDKGKPLPVTVELLEQMPARFLLALVEAINGDMRPNGRRAAS